MGQGHQANDLLSAAIRSGLLHGRTRQDVYAHIHGHDPSCAFSGGTLVAYTTANQLRWQIRLCTISLLLTMINLIVSYLPSGYCLGRQEGAATIWMAPYHVIAILRSFLLPSWLGGKSMLFSSSGSIKSALNERDPLNRASLHHRLKVVMIDCGGIVHLTFVLFTIAAVTWGCVRAFEQEGKWNRLQYLLTHAGWPPMLWFPMVNAALIPLRYAIWPPSVPDWEEFLERDQKTSIAYPKKEWKISDGLSAPTFKRYCIR